MNHSLNKVYVSVTNDLITDQRVEKVCESLSKNGYTVELIGRKFRSSEPLKSRGYKTKRFNLWFTTGFLFYANYNLCLFFYLLFQKKGILLANDLDTLLANYWIAQFKTTPLFYDSHEYFTEVPELIYRPRVKRVWEVIESFILPKIRHAYTVSPLIVKAYKEKYQVEFKLVRNFPKLEKPLPIETTREKDIILYQGALNVHRGLEEIIEAMKYVSSAELWIAGRGDIERELKVKVIKMNLGNKVKFLGRLLPDDLRKVTMQASIGLSIEKGEGLNYQYALPNKVFDYIHSGVPVLYSDLKALKETICGFTIGEELKSYKAELLGQQIEEMLLNKDYSKWKEECLKAAKLFNWQKEEQTLFTIFAALEQN